MLLLATCVPAPTAPAPAGPTPAVLVGAADVAGCNWTGDEATAELLDGIRGTIFIPGDVIYNFGTDAEFARCYEPSWGRHKARICPAVSNHEYLTFGAAARLGYLGLAAGPTKIWTR
jgi:acid phosphatase type 7